MASSRCQVEVSVIAAKDLKNVNRRHGPLRPYAVVWVDPNNKYSTRADPRGDSFPVWDQTFLIPLPPGTAVDDATLHVDVVHFGSEDGTKLLIGSARLRMRDVLKDDDGYGGGGRAKMRSLQLKQPSGWPHGKVDVKVTVKEMRHREPPTVYGVPLPRARREYSTPSAYTAPPAYVSAYGNPYASSSQPQYKRQDLYYRTTAPAEYPSDSGTSYGQVLPSYGQKEKKKSKLGGMGTGLAVGAVAGLFGGLALAKGVDYVEDKISNNVAEEVEDDFGDQDYGNNGEDDFVEQGDDYNGNEQDDGDDDFAKQEDADDYFAYQDDGAEGNVVAYQDDGYEDFANQDDGAEGNVVAYQDDGYEDFANQDDGEGNVVAYQDGGYDNFANQDDGQGDVVAYQDDGYENFNDQDNREGDVAYQDAGYGDFADQDDVKDYYVDREGDVTYQDAGYGDFVDQDDGKDDYADRDEYY